MLNTHALTPAVILVENGCTLVDAITAANTDTATGNCPAGADADDIVLTGDVLLTASVDGENGLPVVTSEIAIAGNDFEVARETTAAEFRLLKIDAGGNADLTVENLSLTIDRCRENPEAPSTSAFTTSSS